MKHFITLAFTALVALMSFAPNTATAQTAEPLDTVELYFESFYADPLYLEAGDWTIILKNERYQFTFDLYNYNPESLAGTYTEKDLDINFSWAGIPEAYGNISYIKTCNIVIKKEQISTCYFKYIFDAELISTLGKGGEVNGAFKLHAEHYVIEPSARYDVAINNCKITLKETRFSIAGKNDTMDVDMTFLTTEDDITGYYIHKQLAADKTTFKHRDVAYSIIELEAVIRSSDTPSGGIAYVAMMEILANSEKDTIFFNVAMEAPVTPVKTVDVFCQNLFIDQSRAAESVITLLASNDEYSIEIGCNDKVVRDSATYSGTMGAGSIIEDLARDKTINGLSTTVTLVGSKDKGYTATARVFSEEHVCYNLRLTNIIEIKDTVDIKFNNNSKAMFDIDELGPRELQLAGYNMNYSVAFDILNIDRILVTEEFKLADLFLDNNASFLIKHSPEGDKDVEFIQVHGSIKQRNDSTFLNAIVHGLDSTLYNISMFYTVPPPTDTLEFTFKEDLTEFTNALPQNTFILKGFSDDAQVMCNIQVNRTSSVEGTFICDGQFEENQFEPFETYVGTLKDASKMEFDVHYMQKGEMTASIDSLGKVHATAKFICDNAVLYILHFNFTYVRPRLPYDTEDEGVNTTIGKEAEVTIDDQFFESHGYIEYVLYVENPFNELALVFFIEEKDPDIVIPAGVYPFGVYGSKNHVLASRGMKQDNTGMYPLPSYYQTLDELGQPHGYFLVDGTVTVEKVDGRIVMNVDAINSYGLPVKLLYYGKNRTYNITLLCDEEQGVVTGRTSAEYLDEITLTAKPNQGHHFTQWSDGNTDNPRTIVLTQDTTFSAYFALNRYSVSTQSSNIESGTTFGDTITTYLDYVTISATANYGYHFTQWSDGNTDNPRTLVLTQDTTLTAEFAQSFSGRCGDNLYWSYYEDTKTISITGSGKMYDYTADTQPWLLFREQIKEVTTTNTVTYIGTSAFEGCARLGKISLGTSLEKIAANAFAGCTRLYDIYSYPIYPPFAELSSFANYEVYLYIPCEGARDYKLDLVWKKFMTIDCIGAETGEVEADSVKVEPSTNSVTITWPTDENADTYSIEIKRGDVVFCTLTFSKDGMLTNIAFAPSRSGSHPVTYAASTGNGLRFTVTSLDAATTYGYNVTTKDEADNTLSTYSGEFTTKSNVTTDMDNIQSPVTTCQKLLRDGQLLILKEGKTYNAMGQEM